MCLIKKGKVEYMRNLKSDNHKVFERKEPFQFKKDRVQVLNEYRHKVSVTTESQPMDLS